MASTPNPIGLEDTNVETASLSIALQASSLSDVERPPQHDAEKSQTDSSTNRPLRIYSRAQLLHLHRSPLVQPPPDMPELKMWFGMENEQNLVKKDAEQSTPGGSRDRRFRRDYEEGEAPSRPPFRSTLTQPSQMGNFKHQSLRDRDKERDRDGERDRERDLRDREGQERLRHLSDKYDRDRLGLTASARTKERDTTNPTKASSQTQVSSTATRRGEPRDPSKRKANESGDDWRRGGEVSRNTREDRSDTTRRDRARDSSRPRPEPSNRRDRNVDREDGRERSNRERDERGDDGDDGRHWRDDGKRDERVATRKARERGGDHWEPSSDRRWAATEEREGRYKRGTGRERRTDDGRERDDRKDREREREKEKEPAWMETYVPSEPLSGILGGAPTGELDGIQAWKKGMKDKEKEKDEKEVVNRSMNEGNALTNDEKSTREDGQPAQPMDEIQLFRLMMQKAKEVPEIEGSAATGAAAIPSGTGLVTQDLARTEETAVGAPKSDQRVETKDPLAQGAPSTGGPAFLSSKLSAIETSANSIPTPSEKSVANSPSQFNPPPGPRLLALGRGAKQPPLPSPNPPLVLANPHIEAHQAPAGYNSFEDVAHQRAPLGRVTPNGPLLSESLRRMPMDRSPLNHPQQFGPGILDNGQIDASGNGYAAPKGSRFAKFFDGKGREGPPPKTQTPIGFTSPSPNLGHGQRFDQAGLGGPSNGVGEQRTMDDIIAMLANSQAHRSAQNINVNPGLPSAQPNPNFNSHNHNAHPILHQHQLNSNRSESLYDSRLDDRSFVPDGMVPGLRTAPPPRSRDNFPEPMDDPILHLQRLAQQQQLQQRADPNFGAPSNPMFAQQPRPMGLPIQSQPFRGGPSPNTAQQLGMPSRAMPPGLANLGSRPPHEASQFLGLQGGPTGPQLAALNHGQLHQQQFNSFNNGNNSLGFTGHQQFRGPVPSTNHQNASGHLPLGNLPQNNIDPRLAAQGFGLGGNMPVGQRGLPPPQRPGHQLQGHHLGLGPQQRGQLPPHMLSHNVHGQGPQGPTNQPAQDLMALLLGGTHRNE